MIYGIWYVIYDIWYTVYDNLREFVVTHVILAPGVGNLGPVLGGLTPFPVDPADPLDCVENSEGFKKR